MYMRCDGGWSAEIQIQPWRLESVAAKSYRIACLQQCMQCNASTAMAYTPTRPRTYLHAHAHTYTHTRAHAKGTEPWGIPKWRLADFPSGESAKSQHFTVVDASENEVVAAVLHTQTDIRGIGKMVVSGVPAITQEVNLSRALFSELLPESSAPLELRLVFHKENPLGCPENGTYSWEDDSEVVEPFAIVVRRGTNYTAVPIPPPSILVDSREEIMIGCAATPPPQPSPPLGGCG